MIFMNSSTISCSLLPRGDLVGDLEKIAHCVSTFTEHASHRQLHIAGCSQCTINFAGEF